MTDTLDLPGWRYIDKLLDDDGYEINVEYTIDTEVCQKCGVVGNLYKHGTKDITYRDGSLWGRPARLLVKARRYKCKDCGGTFMQVLEDMDTEYRMTRRCIKYIEDYCLKDTFTRLAEHIGCDEKTVRNVASDYIARMQESFDPQLPVWLGIDETQLDGGMRCIITDIGSRRPIDILPTRDHATLTAWLSRFKDRSMVQGLAIDMWRPYQSVAAKMFPGMPVVIDKFHVVRMAGQGMEKTRIRLAKDKTNAIRKDWMRRKTLLRMRHNKLGEQQRFALDMWLTNEPEMGLAHALKESFYDIYEMERGRAIAAFDDWPNTVPVSLKGDFKELLSAMKNWREHILAYFDHPISNAYTESLNGVAKVMNRGGRGYSYEILRAKILFSERKVPPPVQEPWRVRTMFEASATNLAVYGQTYGNTCEGCRRKFHLGPGGLTHVMTLSLKSRAKTGLICEACFDKFHTEWVKSHKSLSTQ